MRKFFVSLAVFVISESVFCNVCNAARNNKSDEVLNGAGFDGNIGSSIATFKTGDNKEMTGQNIKYGFGGFYEFGMNSSLSLRTSLYYAKRNHLEDLGDKVNKVEEIVNMHCLDPKVLLVWLPAGPRGGWFLYIGPVFYYVFSSSESNVKSTGTPTDVKEEDKWYKPTSFNAGLGLGVDYEIAQSGIRIGLDIESFWLNYLEWGSGAKKQVERMAKILGRVVVKDLPKMENMIGGFVFSVKFDILKMLG